MPVVLAVLGAALVVAGVALVSPAAALVVAGLALLAAGYLAAYLAARRPVPADRRSRR